MTDGLPYLTLESIHLAEETVKLQTRVFLFFSGMKPNARDVIPSVAWS